MVNISSTEVQAWEVLGLSSRAASGRVLQMDTTVNFSVVYYHFSPPVLQPVCVQRTGRRQTGRNNLKYGLCPLSSEGNTSFLLVSLLRDPDKADAFDTDLLALIRRAEFKIVAVVIDKKALQLQYPTPAHPYHLGLGFMLQRYCGFLNHINRRGDVMAESRGGHEDLLLKDSYSWVYQRGLFGRTDATFFQQALTSKELKVKPKTANIAGLQLADLLANPLRKAVLIKRHKVQGPLAPFAERMLETVKNKLNRHLYNGRVEGYGEILFPK